MPKKLKKDFDRDKMYSKIMPSVVIEPPRFEEEQFQEPSPEPKTDERPAEYGLELELSEPRLHNFMEDMLREKLPHTMKVLRACPCERCTLDIIAIALNALPCAYAVTTKDDSAERIKKLRREYEVKVTATLIKAIQQVKAAPRHEKPESPLE